MIHKIIKDQIKDALRAKDTIRLDTLRGLNALFMNDLLMSSPGAKTQGADGEFISDDKALALIKRSAKQRKDSIDQFTKGGREDLVAKEQAELAILESFMPTLMTRDQIMLVAKVRIDSIKASGTIDPKASGKIVGMIMKELAGKADGMDVKAVVEELLASD
ncbi:MAG: GatB/YqeY domain-containing protein [Candidatus Taylorbacteria bacterium]